MVNTPLIRIGTRGSQLALWQATHVKSLIESGFPDYTVALHVIRTTGDRITDRPLSRIGGKGLFVTEIESALLNGEVDIAVHSMKDMPGTLPPGLTIGAVPPRENPFDILIARDGIRLEDYPVGFCVGTSSLRRASQLRNRRPDLKIRSIRGNLDTRIRKLQDGEYDAIVLAAAGLIRLGQEHIITQYLDDSLMIPAAGQGALCIESRNADTDMTPILQLLDHGPTRTCVTGERAFLQEIEGSCHIPVACFGRIVDDRLTLVAMVASEDGSRMVSHQQTGSPSDAVRLGRNLATHLLTSGGKHILEALTIHET